MYSAKFECIRQNSNVFGQIRMHSAGQIRSFFVEAGIRSFEQALLARLLFGAENQVDARSVSIIRVFLTFFNAYCEAAREIISLFECIRPKFECIRPVWLNTLSFLRPNTLF